MTGKKKNHEMLKQVQHDRKEKNHEMLKQVQHDRKETAHDKQQQHINKFIFGNWRSGVHPVK